MKNPLEKQVYEPSIGSYITVEEALNINRDCLDQVSDVLLKKDCVRTKDEYIQLRKRREQLINMLNNG